jgi:hypothetical protein
VLGNCGESEADIFVNVLEFWIILKLANHYCYLYRAVQKIPVESNSLSEKSFEAVAKWGCLYLP